MKYFRAVLILSIAVEALAQGLVEKPVIDANPVQSPGQGLAQDALIRSFDMRMFDGRMTRKRISFGNETVVLENIMIDTDIRTRPKVKGVCQIRLMINDVPLKMSLKHVEGTRGHSRPIPQPEDDSAPPGLAGTYRLPSIYPALLEPLTAPVKLNPKDRLTIELSSPSKKINCSASLVVSTAAVARADAK